MTSSLRITSLLAAAAASLTFAACGGDGNGPTHPGGGDSRALGDRAVSPFVDYGTDALTETEIAVTVTGLRKGTKADMKDFALDEDEKARIPYYVDAEFENVGDVAVTRSLLRASVEADGKEYRPATLILLGGEFKPCPEYSDAKLGPGESFTGCSTVLLPADAHVDRLRFQGDVTKDPITWKTN